MKKVDLAGKRFGKWLVLARSKRRSYWLCRCDCGTEKEVFHGHLKSGASRSCRCATYPHKHPAYVVLHGMKIRCYCETAPIYKNYGAKGIKICQQWLDDPWNFLNWADTNGYAKNMTIERVDYLGNYTPENCTWIPLEEQPHNRSVTLKVEWEGEILPLAKLAKRYGHPYQRVYKRITRGWSLHDAILKEV